MTMDRLGRRFVSTSQRLSLLRSSSCLLFKGFRGSFPGVKRPEGKAHCSPPHNTDTQNDWSYTSTSPNSFTVSTWTTCLYLLTYIHLSKVASFAARRCEGWMSCILLVCRPSFSDRPEVTLPIEYVTTVRHKTRCLCDWGKQLTSFFGHVI
jgi:hypothetical protein